MSTAVERLMAARTELNARCNTIEEAYEFMLAYAGQGMASDAGSGLEGVFAARCCRHGAERDAGGAGHRNGGGGGV